MTQQTEQFRLYCPHCRRLFDGDLCPDCKSRRAAPRTVQQGDLCFATEQAQIWSEMLADVFQQNGIAFEKEGRLGPAISTIIGFSQESYRFYVPFEQLETALELIEELFGGKGAAEEESEQPESEMPPQQEA